MKIMPTVFKSNLYVLFALAFGSCENRAAFITTSQVGELQGYVTTGHCLKSSSLDNKIKVHYATLNNIQQQLKDEGIEKKSIFYHIIYEPMS